MHKFVLLGSNNPNPSKMNLKVISSSNDMKELIDIWTAVDEFYDEIGETYTGNLSQAAKEMLKKNSYLDKLFDIQFESIIWTVEVIGIFKTIRTGDIQDNFLY